MEGRKAGWRMMERDSVWWIEETVVEKHDGGKEDKFIGKSKVNRKRKNVK